jgi:hypothetical protein
MTDAYILLEMVADEQREFADMLRGLTAGTGPEVRGPGEAIFMALNGRSAVLADLSGDGVATLAARLS